jgi:hypothetical protein
MLDAQCTFLTMVRRNCRAALTTKVAARVTELITRIKVALPSAYPHQASFVRLAASATQRPS